MAALRACDRGSPGDPNRRTGSASRELAPLADRTFDDHYALGTDRHFGLRARGRSVDLRFGPTYPYAQLFVPASGEFAAIEPMTATIDALGRGTAPSVAPGNRFRAWFTVAASSDASRPR